MRRSISFIFSSISALLLALVFVVLVFSIVGVLSDHIAALLNYPPYIPVVVAAILLCLFFIISGLILCLKYPLRQSLKIALNPTLLKVHFLIYTFIFFCTHALFSTHKEPDTKYIITGADHIPDSSLVYRYPADTQRHEIIIRGLDTIINAEYTFDRFGRRLMPERRNVTQATIFMGCSYTFGDGVSDNQTLPYQYYENDTTKNVYNYAIDGWGPQQTLKLLQKRNIRNEVLGDTVTGIYVFIEDHLRRVICDKHHVVSWTKDFDCFAIEHDSLISKGTFAEQYPYRLWFYKIITETKVFDRFDIPLHPTIDSYRITAGIIKQSALAFGHQFKQSRFYVVIYPGQDTHIIPYLETLGVKVIDLSSLFKDPVEMLIPNHGHPIPKAYEIVAQKIYDKTGK